MFGADLIRTVDERVRRLLAELGITASTATGTVASRGTSFYEREAMVVFDGSNLAIPVRVWANVEVDEGDRVALQRFGTVWFVVGCGTRHWPEEVGHSGLATPGNTTSVNFTAFPSAPSATFNKRFDETRIRAYVEAMTFSNTAGSTAGALGARVYRGAEEYYVTVTRTWHADALKTHPHNGIGWILDAPAGTYTAEPLWAYVSGAGSVNQDGNCWISFSFTEVEP